MNYLSTVLGELRKSYDKFANLGYSSGISSHVRARIKGIRNMRCWIVPMSSSQLQGTLWSTCAMARCEKGLGKTNSHMKFLLHTLERSAQMVQLILKQIFLDNGPMIETVIKILGYGITGITKESYLSFKGRGTMGNLNCWLLWIKPLGLSLGSGEGNFNQCQRGAANPSMFRLMGKRFDYIFQKVKGMRNSRKMECDSIKLWLKDEVKIDKKDKSLIRQVFTVYPLYDAYCKRRGFTPKPDKELKEYFKSTPKLKKRTKKCIVWLGIAHTKVLDENDNISLLT